MLRAERAERDVALPWSVSANCFPSFPRWYGSIEPHTFSTHLHSPSLPPIALYSYTPPSHFSETDAPSPIAQGRG